MKVEFEKNQRSLCHEEIPNGWRVALLKDLSLLKISNGAFNDPKCVGSGYKLINIVDLYQGPKIRTENLGRLSLSESEYKTFKVLRGDLFFTRSSLKKEGIAHCNVFLSDEENVVYECHMMRVRPNPELVDSKFLQEFCLAGPARDYFISHGKTTTMTTIDQGSIGGLPVLLPPLPEQQKIAAVLTAVDDKLDVIARQIEATETLKKGLMQTLFSRGVGTQDSTGRWIPHTEFKDSELGEIPCAWSTGKLSDLVKVIYGKSPTEIEKTDAGIPIFGTGGVTGYTNTVLYQGPSIILGRKGTIDKVQWIDGPFWAIDTTFYTTPKQTFDWSWLYYLISSFDLRKLNEASGVPSLSRSSLEALCLSIPPLPEQKEIGSILITADEKLALLGCKASYFSTLKRGLVQKLLTGEWRVKLDSCTGSV